MAASDGSVLIDATMRGQVDRIRDLLSAGVSVTWHDAVRHRSCVHWACALLRPDVLGVLVGAIGVDLLALDGDGNAPIHVVVQAAGSTAGKSGEDGTTRALTCLGLLVDKGVPVSLANSNGWTALHIAASIGLLDLCRFLLSKALATDLDRPGFAAPDQLSSCSGCGTHHPANVAVNVVDVGTREGVTVAEYGRCAAFAGGPAYSCSAKASASGRALLAAAASPQPPKLLTNRIDTGIVVHRPPVTEPAPPVITEDVFAPRAPSIK